MHLPLLSGAVLGLIAPTLAIPVQDSPRQRLLDGKGLPSKYRSSAPPYTPGHKDKYDGPVDSVGDELDPLPYRNGLGASVLGPWNEARSRQNPDLVRPPSTDHGNLANMRWSFADSHIRIEVCFPVTMRCWRGLCRTNIHPRKAAGPDRLQFASYPRASSWPASTCDWTRV